MDTHSGQRVTQQEFIDWNSSPLVVHEDLRHNERAFDSVCFYDGVPFVPWTSLQPKMSPKKSRQLSGAIEKHFRGERLFARGFDYRLSTGDCQSNQQGPAYLRLEHALRDTTMFDCVKKIYKDWEKGPEVDQRPEHKCPHKPGLLYGPEPTSGLYMLYCGTTKSYKANNQMAVRKPSFLLKAGRSHDLAKRFQEHSSSNSDFVRGGDVIFLYGLAVENNSVKRAEALMHAKLTELGFAWPLVTQFPKRTCETYKFSSVALPLIHDVLFKLGGVFPPPPLPPLRNFLSLSSERVIPPLRSPALGLRNLQPPEVQEYQPSVSSLSYFHTEVTSVTQRRLY
ncbi:hypothetical protein P3T76_012725 [Phytophthora citrophthora]|uniref:Uncharacterized protein n=1 Tax=Phytophthora citrophthora TaxID=4793 RepID=A0AAD9LCP4_9STRA|nr:hypothetical protein P3T76_012725 [Phytophthora citrophthora]